MRDYTITESTTVIPAGYLGEHQATRVIFPWAACWTDLNDPSFQLQVLRPGDSAPYAAALVTKDEENVYWIVSSSDTAREGFLTVQLVAYEGTAIAKRLVFQAYVGHALQGSDDEADEYTVSVFLALLEQAQQLTEAQVEQVTQTAAQNLDDMAAAKAEALQTIAAAREEALEDIAEAIEGINAATVEEVKEYLGI